MHLFDARLEYQFLILKQKKTLFSLVNIRLQQEGITTLLLSGDREEAVASIGSTVGIKNENTQSSLTPQEKTGVISTLQGEGHRVAMVTCFNSSSMRCCGQHKNPIICDCIGTSR
jgi:soluble P-type ATPase